MTNERRIQEALLLALPFLLFAGWSVELALWRASADSLFFFEAQRWLLRLLFVGVSIALWRKYRADAMPIWASSWLSMALYELTAVGFLLTFAVSELGALVILACLLLAFAPWLIVQTILGMHNRPLAALVAFPHAALTVPLFLFIKPDNMPMSDPFTSWLMALAMMVCALISYLFSLLRGKARWILLFAGIALAAFVQTLALQLDILGVPIAALLLFGLGSVILIAPLLLDAIWPRLSFLRDEPWRLLSIESWLRRIRQVTYSTTLAPVTGQLSAFPVGNLNTNLPVNNLNQFSEREPLMSDTNDVTKETVNGKDTSDRMQSPPLPVQPVHPPSSGNPPPPNRPDRLDSPGFMRLYRLSVVLLALFAIVAVLTMIGRSSIYKIHEYERGLHLRGGRFLAEQGPGWHYQVPLLDTVIIVKVNERLGYVERIQAMTNDNVTMQVSLQYTYRVTKPEQFALQVDDPERIVFEFVQGKLRDVVNSKPMADVMNDRVTMNDEVMAALKEKEEQYGVQFVTVQMQSASPPDEVLAAIKDRMVAAQRQEQAQAEAAQKKTQADAEFYTAQKQAEADAYQISRIAEADAERIRLTTEVQQLAVRAILAELDGKGVIGEKYIEFLIAQQLKENSKWVISGASTPILDLRSDGESTAVVPGN